MVAADLQVLILGCLRVIDLLIVALAALGAYWVRHDDLDLPDLYVIAIVAALVITVNFFQLGRLYEFQALTRPSIQIGRLTMSWIAVMLSLIALAYFTKTSEAFSRAFVLGWMAASYAGFVIVRLGLLLPIERWRQSGRLSLNVAVIGAGEVGRQLVRQIHARGEGQWRIVGIYDDRRTRVPPEIEGHPVLGTVDDLVRATRDGTIDEIIVALPWRASPRIGEIVKKLKSVPVNVKLCPESLPWNLPVRGFRMVAAVPMLAALERPLSGWSIVVKMLEDRVLAGILVVVLAPLLALIALAIRLDSPGPVLFRQHRYGFNNEAITVFKFRTMFHDRPEDPGVPQARRNDPRITRIGGFLRRSSLDELPQLFNVLRGEMSLVGPRPHAVAHNEQYAKMIDDYLSRHRVKPGITGWAQVNGLRGETNTPDKMRMRVQYDLYYIDNWSLMFDLKILLLTPFRGLIHENAY